VNLAMTSKATDLTAVDVAITRRDALRLA